MKEKITDEYVLNRDILTSHEAADYLGLSWWALTEGLKDGTYTFGTAKRGNGGRYTFTIYAEQAYKFKHGTYDLNGQQYADLIKLLRENADQQKRIAQLIAALILKEV